MRTLLLVIGLLLAGCVVARRPSRVVPPSDPCGNVQLVNPPEFPSQEPLWRAGIKAAGKRCGELYPYSPCLKKFIRVKVNTYRVICGALPEEQ